MRLGLTEILVVLIVALIVLGPDKLPKYAQKLGEALKEFRKFSSDATKEIRESIVEPLEEAQKPLKEAMEPITDLTDEIKSDVKDIKKSFTDLGKPEKKAEPQEETPTEGEAPVEEPVAETDAQEETPPAAEAPATPEAEAEEQVS